ncbi:MAG: hypothetical protein J6Q44_01480 [Alphaproteobacteria bacterium]|nr:hypothetical protein [Alphaproteobacteria bacterium]
MSFLKNTVSLLAIFSVLPAAYAVTARPSVMNTATAISANGTARRMPTMTAYITGTAGTTGSTSSTTSSALLENAECIDAYTACIKGADACGPNFEECTTNVLFHAQMPECLSTLAQCSSNGVNSLFGTSNISALSNVATKNTYGEITEYTYPTTGSVMGQMISAAAIENKYDTSSCVRRYSSCLRKDSVCGADFELCTTNTEFKKQAVFCDSTLARCASDGKLELFGNASATSSTVPSASSRIGEMIAEGAALAAVNAVSTCYKVADQCILNACGANPYKCYENATVETANLVDAINNGTPITELADATATISKSNIASYIKNSCLDTVGSNKYCYATFIGEGVMPTASQLRDEDNQEEVYDLAYGARMNSGMKAKITELVNKFDTRAKEKCIETITNCAMRSCGGGSGAACYSLVFSDAGDNSINGGATRNEIKTACQAVVNTDTNCQYAAQNPNATGTYNYMFTQADAFDTLFPEYDDGAESDPIGAVASLNSKLSTSYNTAAIAQMKKRCQSVATSCVKSMCGNDYVNCYRNRTDIQSSLTNTGEEHFDKSMNKVGGVLDYTIVLGLCIDTVKNADVCTEHLKIEEVKYNMDNTNENVWGGASDVRSGWIDAGSAKSSVGTGEIYATDENGNRLCTNNAGVQGLCDTVDANGAVFSEPVVIGYDTYVQTQAARSLFKDLIYDIEIEAQAKYNAKLTKQQNMCLSSNDGGILGNKDLGSTFMWAKLKSNKVPTNYATAGLKSNQFVASNELYGSFCRVRITLQSDDKYIQDAINGGKDWSTAYFAAGDAFTCGSWIPQSALEEMAKSAGTDAREEKEASQYSGLKWWTTAIGVLGGGVGGGYLGAGIQDGSVFSGLTGKSKKDTKSLTEENCKKYYNSYTTAVADVNTRSAVPTYVNNLIDLVESNTTDATKLEKATQTRSALSQYQSAVSSAGMTFADKYGSASERDCTPAEKEAQAVAAADAQITALAPKCTYRWATIDAYCADGKSNKGVFNTSGDTNTEKQCCGDNDSVKIAAKAAYDRVNNSVCKVQVAASVTESAAQQSAAANNNVLTKKGELDAKMSELRSSCIALANADDDSDAQAKKKRNAALIGAGVTAIAGGALGYHVVDEIQKQELSKAEQEAIKEFMDNVGSKIRCYIGGEEVGTYGDVISTSME